PPAVVQIGVLLLLTGAAVGLGWFSGFYLKGSMKPPVASIPKDKLESLHGKGGKGKEVPHGEEAGEAVMVGHQMIIPLAPITTNLSSPSNIWIRLEASIVLDQPPEPALANTIHQDLLGFVRTLTMHEIEGGS